jgi:hypothetical protein
VDTKEILLVDWDEVGVFLGMWRDTKSAFSWFSPSTKEAKKKMEDKYSMEIEFSLEGKKYRGEIKSSCSTPRVYTSKNFYADGERLTIRALTKIIGTVIQYVEEGCPIEEVPLYTNSYFKEEAIRRLS